MLKLLKLNTIPFVMLLATQGVLAQTPANEAVKQIVVQDNLQIELIAAEPQVIDPVALCFDAGGMLYVVENSSYPTNEDRLGQVVALRDEDGDGYCETRHIFAKDFAYPNGIMPWRDGFLLTDAPEVYFLKDTDGDGVADVREVLMTGFNKGGSTQLRVSHPTLGLDNWIYFTNGLSGGKVQLTGTEGILDMGAYDLRYDPLGARLETTGGRAQFGLTFNDYGQKFVCSNRKHIEHVVMQPTDRERNPYLGAGTVVNDIPEHGGASEIYALSSARTTAYAHNGTFTAACGMVIYRGTSLGESFYGNNFTCDPTGALVHRDILVPDGATYIAKRAYEGKEFLASPDDWFRPVFLTNGPEGALYLCDMYRESIEHPTYLPKEVAAITDFYKGNDRGRIYRIVGKQTNTDVVTLETTAQQVAALGHGDSWVRDTAHRLLLEKLDPAAVPLLQKALEDENVLVRTQALYMLNAFSVLSAERVFSALKDPSPLLREQAILLARTHPEWHETLRATVLAASEDTDARVRFAVALALGDTDEEGRYGALATILRKDVNDSWAQTGVVSGLKSGTDALLAALLAEAPDDRAGWLPLMETLGRMLAQSSEPEYAYTRTQALLDLGSEDSPWWVMAYLNGVSDGLRRNNKFPVGDYPLERLAKVGAEDVNETLQEGLAAWLALALTKLQDTTTTLAHREVAAGLLGYGPFDLGGETLADLLSPATPRELQVAAVNALAQMDHPSVATIMLDGVRWEAYTPPIKAAVLNAVLSRGDRLEKLLDALESSQVPPWSISPAMRNRILHSPNAEIKARAVMVFKDIKTTNRSAVYEEYKPVLELAANPANGQEIFQKVCSTCHLFNGEGYEVGPDLTGISSQPKESILLHILVPNSLLLEGYENYVIQTDDFEEYSGLIVAETEQSITLRQPLGLEVTIERNTITRMMTSSMSMMPEELEKSMTAQELRDLIGYLKGEKTVE